jgi:hypothetical protein
MARKVPYRVIFDPRGLIDSTAPVVTTPLQMADVLRDRDVAPNEIIITPDDRLQETFEAAARYVKTWSRVDDRSLFFLVDECRFIDLRSSSAFEYIMRAAPPDRIHIGLTAHRPADVPTDVRAISDHWLLFRSTQEHDLKVIEERCGLQVRRRVMQLKPHQFVHWNDAAGLWAANTTPHSWFVPLGRPQREAEDILPETDSIDSTRLL